MNRPLCILHLSDLHFSGSADADAKIVIGALLRDIERERKAGTIIDLIVFSGDLVQAGKNREAFDEARKDFIERVIAVAGISPDRFVICPGNHDIDRDVVDKDDYVEVGLLNVLQTRDAINRFVDKYSNTPQSGDMPEPFRRLNIFYEKQWSPRTKDALLSTPFVIALSFSILDQTVGIGLHPVPQTPS